MFSKCYRESGKTSLSFSPFPLCNYESSKQNETEGTFCNYSETDKL